MYHGAGGLAANYRFGARTAGANVMIGSIFVLLGILFGQNAIIILNLLPMSILGVLLVCRRSTGPYDKGPDGKERHLCGPCHAGYNPDCESGNSLYLRYFYCLCAEE